MANRRYQDEQSVQPYQSRRSLGDFNVYTPEYIGTPVNEIANMVDTRSKANQAIFDKMSALDVTMSNLDVNPNDDGARQAMLEQRQRFNEGIDLISQPDNYTLADTYTSKLANDFLKNKWLQTAVENNAKYKGYREDLKKRYEAGKISDAAYKYGLDQPAPNTIMESDNIYSQYSGKPITNYYDYSSDLSNLKFDKKNIRQVSEPIKDEFGNITGYRQKEITSIDEPALRQSMIQLLNSNPEALSSLRQEFEIAGGDPNNIEQWNDYINNAVDPFVKSKVGSSFYKDNKGAYVTDIKNYDDRYSPSQMNSGKTKEDSPFTDRIYLGSQFIKENNDVLKLALDDFSRSQYLNDQTSTSRGLSPAKGMSAATSNLETIDSIDLNSLTPEQNAAYIALNKTVSSMFNKSFENATIEERKQALDKLDKTIHIDSQAYESALGQELTYKSGKALTETLFNSSEFTRDEGDKTFKMTGRFTQGAFFNPYTNEYYESGTDFVNALNNGEVQVRDKDGTSTLGKDAKKLEIRVMSNLNNSNSIPWLTGDFSFTDGNIVSINGYDFIYGDRQKVNPNNVIANVYNRAATTKENVDILPVLKLLGVSIDKEDSFDLSDVEFGVNENGYPEISAYRGSGANRYEDEELSEKLAKQFNKFFNK